MDLGGVSPDSAPDVPTAIDVMYGAEGALAEDAIRAFQVEVDERYREVVPWPFAGSIISTPSSAELAIAPDAWEDVVPEIVEIAHKHGLVAVDPGAEEMYPPG